MKRFYSNSERETEKFAEEFADSLKKGDVIAFEGDLGAGKTAFVRGLAKGLGCTDDVSSPTFAIVNEYSGEIPLFHFDMYRVQTFEDLYSTCFFEYIERGGICAVEWSENIRQALPDNTITVRIDKTGENQRLITVFSEDEK